MIYDTKLGGYLIDIIDRSQLEKAPRYTASNTPEWNRDYRSQVDDYWPGGVTGRLGVSLGESR